MMHEVASHGGGMAAASAVHINLCGPHPIVVFGTPQQTARWIPGWCRGWTRWRSASPNRTQA